MKVNKILRLEAEKNKEDVSISVFNILSSTSEDIADQLTSLGKDEERMDSFLDKIWKQFEHFSEEKREEKIKEELSRELLNWQVADTTKTTTTTTTTTTVSEDTKCSRNEPCWLIVEKGAKTNSL